MAALVAIPACGGSGSGDKAAPAVRHPANATTTTTAAPSTSTTLALAYHTDLDATPGPGVIDVTMKQWKFSPTDIRVPAGTLTVSLKNNEDRCAVSTCLDTDNVHDFTILDPATGMKLAHSDRIEVGGSGIFTVESLPPGTYRFVCSIHAMASMEGTLEVTA